MTSDNSVNFHWLFRLTLGIIAARVQKFVGHNIAVSVFISELEKAFITLYPEKLA